MPSKGAKSDAAKVGPDIAIGLQHDKTDVNARETVRVKHENDDDIAATVDKISAIEAELDVTNVEIDKIKIDQLENNMSELRYVTDGTVRVRSVDSGNSRSSVVLAINHKPIACTEDG